MKVWPLLAVLSLFLLLFLPSRENGHTIHFSAEVLRVVDGDTIEVRILESLGWPEVGRVEKLRLAGVDAFELSEARGVLAKVFVDSLCPPGERIRCEMDGERDPYGRLLARVYLRRGEEWVDLGEELLKRKLARKWED
ncbi:MAG: thermonuclease family protein [Candidatus Hadarchaeales archaeon]